jgi:hypothetical protein
VVEGARVRMREWKPRSPLSTFVYTGDAIRVGVTRVCVPSSVIYGQVSVIHVRTREIHVRANATLHLGQRSTHSGERKPTLR